MLENNGYTNDADLRSPSRLQLVDRYRCKNIYHFHIPPPFFEKREIHLMCEIWRLYLFRKMVSNGTGNNVLCCYCGLYSSNKLFPTIEWSEWVSNFLSSYLRLYSIENILVLESHNITENISLCCSHNIFRAKVTNFFQQQ